jgi:hypothetical protein
MCTNSIFQIVKNNVDDTVKKVFLTINDILMHGGVDV